MKIPVAKHHFIQKMFGFSESTYNFAWKNDPALLNTQKKIWSMLYNQL